MPAHLIFITMKGKLIFWLFVTNLMTITYFGHSFEGACVIFFSFLGVYLTIFND